MAKKKKKAPEEKAPEGAPEWMVTYGDMMTLLLCFFVLLAAFSELKQEHEYKKVVQAIQEAFGYNGGDGTIPTDSSPLRSMIEVLDNLALESKTKTNRSENPVESMQGKHTRVKKIREGLVFTIGGNSTFDRESAVLKEGITEDLRSIAKLLAGRTNKIAIRGHTDAKTLSLGSPWKDLDHLAYTRAKAVKTFLVQEMGIRADRMFVDARGASEPLHSRASSPDAQQVNRRVEIILTEKIVEDFNPDANNTNAEHARGG